MILMLKIQLHLCICMQRINIAWIYKWLICYRTKPSCFDYAGTKDRRARTAQEVTAYRYIIGRINKSFSSITLVVLFLRHNDKNVQYMLFLVVPVLREPVLREQHRFLQESGSRWRQDEADYCSEFSSVLWRCWLDDHLPGKPGKVREFQSGQGKVRENGKSRWKVRVTLKSASSCS